MKKFVAFARVSSREQQREGFSLDVQEEALKRYAKHNDGEIINFAKVAETASDETARKHFNETLDFTIQHAHEVDAILFYKVDRAIRNTHDLCKLEQLESHGGVLVEFTSQPFPHTPSGWMQVRNLANFSTYQTQQQSLDVREGIERRVMNGLFPQKAPYGYENYRENGRSLVRVHAVHGPVIRRIFELYAYHGHTIDSLIEQLEKEGVQNTRSKPRFTRSKIGQILHDRSYVGDISYKGEWWPGSQTHLVDATTWSRVEVLRGKARYHSHNLLFGNGLITCAHCGHIVTGEAVKKQLKSGDERRHTYYRCSRYTEAGHPRTRLKPADIERELLRLFNLLRIGEPDVRDLFGDILRRKTQHEQKHASGNVVELNRELTIVLNNLDELLNLRMAREIEADEHARKRKELRSRQSTLMLQVEAQTRQRDENADIALKAFELSQSIKDRWLTADDDAKRRLLEILCLNLSLDGVSLVPEWRKPFDVLAKGLVPEKSRDDRI